MNNTIKRSLFKLGTLSLSGLMGLSLCAPALSANASRRPVRHHTRTARKSRLTRREKRTLKRNRAMIARIKRTIHKDRTLRYNRTARIVFNQLRKAGYSHNQSVAIVASINNRVASYKGLISNGKVMNALSYRNGAKTYAKANHTKPSRINTRLGRLSTIAPRVTHFKTEKGSQYKLYNSFNRGVLKATVPTSRRKTMNYLRNIRKTLWANGTYNSAKTNNVKRTRKGKVTKRTKGVKNRRANHKSNNYLETKSSKYLEASK